MQNFKKLTKYKFLKNIVIRVAKRPIGLKNGSDIDDLLKILYYEGESIYLSSKDFYAEIAKETQSCNSQRTIDKHSKLLKTGYSYISRMTFRTTPFGLFAGCGVIKWGVENNVKINGVTRYTKLDARYLYELILSIERIPHPG